MTISSISNTPSECIEREELPVSEDLLRTMAEITDLMLRLSSKQSKASSESKTKLKRDAEKATKEDADFTKKKGISVFAASVLFGGLAGATGGWTGASSLIQAAGGIAGTPFEAWGKIATYESSVAQQELQAVQSASGGSDSLKDAALHNLSATTSLLSRSAGG